MNGGVSAVSSLPSATDEQQVPGRDRSFFDATGTQRLTWPGLNAAHDLFETRGKFDWAAPPALICLLPTLGAARLS
jgi:hypothetical protein